MTPFSTEKTDEHINKTRACEVRNKILDAVCCSPHMEKWGFAMRKIAAEIEYSPTVIYSHCKDKDALLRSLAEQDNSVLTNKMGAHKQELNPANQLRLSGSVWAENL